MAIDVKRGIRRLLIVLSVGYWGLAACAVWSAYHDAADAALTKDQVALSLEGSQLIAIGTVPEGSTCADAVAAENKWVREHPEKHFPTVSRSACNEAEASAREIRRRVGAKAIWPALEPWVIAYVSVAVIGAAVVWIWRGFRGRAA
jgi:hypothetical protein